MPRELEIPVEERFAQFLREEAERQGKDPAVLAGELMTQLLSKRTKPTSNRGTVTPFRRKT